MYHVTLDGFRGYRSRFDDIRLVQEVLEELPLILEVQPTMPAFLLPYYNGVVPEDCGISAFVFLEGGHCTIHTFSFRETYFADVVSPRAFDAERLYRHLQVAFPCAITAVSALPRDGTPVEAPEADPKADFGPHYFLDLTDYTGPARLDEVFDLFDRLPGVIGMTPIMRPYVLRGRTADGRQHVSAMTMIAESHLALHVFPGDRRAHFDLFSCRFFDHTAVIPLIRRELPGTVRGEALIARGRRYGYLRMDGPGHTAQARAWVRVLPASAPAGEGGASSG